MDVTGAAGTLYEGERFKLQFKFGSRYPFDSPEVILFCDVSACGFVVVMLF